MTAVAIEERLEPRKRLEGPELVKHLRGMLVAAAGEASAVLQKQRELMVTMAQLEMPGVVERALLDAMASKHNAARNCFGATLQALRECDPDVGELKRLNEGMPTALTMDDQQASLTKWRERYDRAVAEEAKLDAYPQWPQPKDG